MWAIKIQAVKMVAFDYKQPRVVNWKTVCSSPWLIITRPMTSVFVIFFVNMLSTSEWSV